MNIRATPLLPMTAGSVCIYLPLSNSNCVNPALKKEPFVWFQTAFIMTYDSDLPKMLPFGKQLKKKGIMRIAPDPWWVGGSDGLTDEEIFLGRNRRIRNRMRGGVGGRQWYSASRSIG